MFSTCPFCSFVRSSVTKQTCENDILKINEPNLLQIGKGGQWSKRLKRSTLGVRKSKQGYDAEITFGGLAEAAFSTPSV